MTNLMYTVEKTEFIKVRCTLLRMHLFYHKHAFLKRKIKPSSIKQLLQIMIQVLQAFSTH